MNCFKDYTHQNTEPKQILLTVPGAISYASENLNMKEDSKSPCKVLKNFNCNPQSKTKSHPLKLLCKNLYSSIVEESSKSPTKEVQIKIKITRPECSPKHTLNQKITDIKENSRNEDIHLNLDSSHFFNESSQIIELNSTSSKMPILSDNSFNAKVFAKNGGSCVRNKSRNLRKAFETNISNTACRAKCKLKRKIKSPKDCKQQSLFFEQLQNRPFSAPRKREIKKSNNTWIIQKALIYSRKHKLSIAYSPKAMQKTIAKIKESIQQSN